jgi:3'-phosphoadenosine 5'-phosphosulfate sulfotransferase (PAPS reductase)/FAD synthetase
MDIRVRLRLLDAVRRAEQAQAAHAAAERSLTRATEAAAQALNDALHLQNELAHAATGTEAADLANKLEAARTAYAAGGRKKTAARHKARRSYLTARSANRELGKLYRKYARRRGTSNLPRAGVAAGLLDELAAAPIDLLRAADVILIQSSAGKDSLVMLDQLATWAQQAGVLDKIVVVHCDLGDESEWPGVRELAQRQAERYGLRFLIARAEDQDAEPDAAGERPALGLLGLVKRRRMWPDALRRLCTATLKRSVADRLLTRVLDELDLDNQAVVVNCMGIRAAESPARARKAALSIDVRTSSSNRLVLVWHPIFYLTELQVWQHIADHGLEYHPTYDALIPRLSCVLCVLAPFGTLVRAVRLCWALGLDLPARYQDLETEIGHRFKNQFSLAEVIAEARRLQADEGPLLWTRGDAIAHHLGQDAAAAYLRRLEGASR